MCQICLIWSILLENAACPFKMYGHDASQVSTKKRGIWRFSGSIFSLIIKQKAGVCDWSIFSVDMCWVKCSTKKWEEQEGTGSNCITLLGLKRFLGGSRSGVILAISACLSPYIHTSLHARFPRSTRKAANERRCKPWHLQPIWKCPLNVTIHGGVDE